MNDKKKKSMVIYLPSLASGGAERMNINLARDFIAAGWDVTFLLQRATGAFLSVAPEAARVVSLNARRTLSSLLPLVKFLKAEKPDILFSHLGHNNVLAIWAVALAGVPTRVAASQHSSLSLESAERQEWQHRMLPLLYRLFLRRAHGIICVSEGVADDLAAATGIPRNRISVIYNPVILNNFDERMQAPATHPWLAKKTGPVILGVGRLEEQKDFRTLIEAFASLVKKRDARLIILGEGPLMGALAAHAKALGIGERVDMPGFVENPMPFMREADLLVMSSRYEGFGNVLVEALACGTQVVSTDCPHGPSEILEGGKYGRLVPVGAPGALADAMLATLDNPLPVELLTARGRSFTSDRSSECYLRLFDAVSGE